jgi:hypothetical protein
MSSSSFPNYLITKVGDLMVIDKILVKVSKSIKNLSIPSNINTIAPSALRYCTNLKNVIVPNSVKAINNSNFQYCSRLESVTIPSSVKYVGIDLFRYCESLDSRLITKDCTYGANNVYISTPGTYYVQGTPTSSYWTCNAYVNGEQKLHCYDGDVQATLIVLSSSNTVTFKCESNWGGQSHEGIKANVRIVRVS